MAREVHAEGLRERQNMREASTPGDPPALLYECRICGADHGTSRHTDCPECGLRPTDFYDGPWGDEGAFAREKPDGARFPFDTSSTWSSTVVGQLGD